MSSFVTIEKLTRIRKLYKALENKRIIYLKFFMLLHGLYKGLIRIVLPGVSFLDLSVYTSEPLIGRGRLFLDYLII